MGGAGAKAMITKDSWAFLLLTNYFSSRPWPNGINVRPLRHHQSESHPFGLRLRYQPSQVLLTAGRIGPEHDLGRVDPPPPTALGFHQRYRVTIPAFCPSTGFPRSSADAIRHYLVPVMRQPSVLGSNILGQNCFDALRGCARRAVCIE